MSRAPPCAYYNRKQAVGISSILSSTHRLFDLRRIDISTNISNDSMESHGNPSILFLLDSSMRATEFSAIRKMCRRPLLRWRASAWEKPTEYAKFSPRKKQTVSSKHIDQPSRKALVEKESTALPSIQSGT